MENPRAEKVALVADVRDRLSSAGATLLTEYRGLDVAAMAQLRRDLREAGGEIKIYKNTMVRLAAAELELDIDDMLTGPTALAFVEGDPVNVAKALRDFSRTHPALVVKGGLLDDQTLDATRARALADIETRDVLLSRFAGGLAAPMQRFAALLNALPQKFAYGLSALIDQRGAAGSAPAGAAADGTGAAEETAAEEAAAEETAAEVAAPETEDPDDDTTPADEAEDPQES